MKTEKDYYIRTIVKGHHALIPAAPGKRPWVELKPNGLLFVRHGWLLKWPRDHAASAVAMAALLALIGLQQLPRSTFGAANESVRTLALEEGAKLGWRFWLVRLTGWLRLLLRLT